MWPLTSSVENRGPDPGINTRQGPNEVIKTHWMLVWKSVHDFLRPWMWTHILNKENRTDAGSWMPPRRQKGHFPKYWWMCLPLAWSSVVSRWIQSYLHSSRHVQRVRRKGNDSASRAEEFGQRLNAQWETHPMNSGLVSPEEALTRTGRRTTARETTYDHFIVKGRPCLVTMAIRKETETE